jgi:hypothetical protein
MVAFEFWVQAGILRPLVIIQGYRVTTHPSVDIYQRDG